jgi:hypothetical protein
VVANPNFEKIEDSNKRDYYFETILETYARHEHTQNVPVLIQEGIKKGIYIPQSHGREHVHVKRYMEAINSDSEKEKIAFNNRAIISSKSKVCNKPFTKNYFAGQDYSDLEELTEIERITKEGLSLFEKIFGFKSKTFTPQGSYWGDHLLKTLAENNVKLACGQQSMPDLKGSHNTINKTWGRKNKYSQIYYRRNVLFEPARNQNFDWVNKSLSEIEIAFRWGKPAVISSHRENFIGSIFEENRIQSLKKLEQLLTAVMKKWPDVKFISSAQLAEIMIK